VSCALRTVCGICEPALRGELSGATAGLSHQLLVHRFARLEQFHPNTSSSGAEDCEPGLSAVRVRVLRLLKRFGNNATSFQVLEPGYQYFFDRDDACVAYVATWCAWVAAGEPIAPRARQAEVAERFAHAARRAGKFAVCALTEPAFVERGNFAALCLGQQPIWDPTAWWEVLARKRSLREQLRRARAKGVVVRPVAAREVRRPEAALRRELDALIACWLRTRGMASMGFLVRVHLFEFIEERRLFVAQLDGRACGVISLVPIYARNGYMVEDLLRAPDAPNGTAESLLDCAVRAAAAEGCRHLTLGLAPLSGDGVHVLLRYIGWLGRGFFDFAGLHAFKAKFSPQAWTQVYLSYPKRHSVWVAVYAMLAAFAQGSLLAFFVRTLWLRTRKILTGKPALR